MNLSPLYSKLTSQNSNFYINHYTDQERATLSESYLPGIPLEWLKSVLDNLAQSNPNDRSILQTCKVFYRIGFISFHETITTDFFLRKIKKDFHAFDFFLLPILSLPKINPFAENNYAIRLASQYGYVEVVKWLLEVPHINPATIDNFTIRVASQNGHTAIVKMLLKHKSINPAADNNFAIRVASANNYVEIVEALLQDSRVNPTAINNFTIRLASQNGHTDIVKMLLKDPRVDPSAKNNFAIRFAHQNGHVEIVKLLLKDPRVNPAAANNHAIDSEIENNYQHILEEVLKNSSFKSHSKMKSRLLKVAKELRNCRSKLFSLKP